MKDKIEEILREHQDRDARTSLAFFLCFNLLDDECKLTSGEIRCVIYEALDILGVEE